MTTHADGLPTAHSTHLIQEPTPDLTIRVRSVMSRPLITVDAEAPLHEAQALMLGIGTHHLVVESQGRPVAILSDRDLLRHSSHRLGTAAERRDDTRTLDRRVFQVATYRPVTIHRDALAVEAAAMLLEHGFSSLPVVNDAGRWVGIVTPRDLLRALLGCILPSVLASK